MAGSGWQRRNERARALGYRNYYDYRMHGYGMTAPTAPRASGEQARRLRGHASASGLARKVTRGRVELAIVEPTRKDPKTGRYSRARVDVMMDDGTDQHYWLNAAQLQGDYARRLGQAIRDSGAVLLDAYGLLGPATSAEGPSAAAAA